MIALEREMGITIVIVAGVALITVIGMAGDYITKTKVAKARGNPAEVEQLKKRIGDLESELSDQRQKIAALESGLSFTTKLLEDKKP
jgi:hypothetical protein